MTSNWGSSPCVAFVMGHPNFDFKLVRCQTKPEKDRVVVILSAVGAIA